MTKKKANLTVWYRKQWKFIHLQITKQNIRSEDNVATIKTISKEAYQFLMPT